MSIDTAKKPIFQNNSLRVGDSIFTLKYFTETDVPAILTLEQANHEFPWKLSSFQSSLKSHHCIGLQYHNQWIAHAVLSFVVGEAELLLFVVDRCWQGRGVASGFLREIIRQSKMNAESMFLEVRESNARARTLYDAVGFNEVGVRPNYYPASSGRGENAVLLALDLGMWDE